MFKGLSPVTGDEDATCEYVENLAVGMVVNTFVGPVEITKIKREKNAKKDKTDQYDEPGFQEEDTVEIGGKIDGKTVKNFLRNFNPKGYIEVLDDGSKPKKPQG